MRMWMVDPRILCRKHLLGEHSELHKFLPSWKKRHSIKGRVASNSIEPLSYVERHEDLAVEMLKRGYKHESPLSAPDFSYLDVGYLNTKVDREKALRLLLDRCPECKERFESLDSSER